MLRLYNTLTRSLEDFTPFAAPRVTLYTCGPTVWNFAHIGNFRTFVFEDVLRRYLAYAGYDVVQVMNLTDVDDRTITPPPTPPGCSWPTTRGPLPRPSWKTATTCASSRHIITRRRRSTSPA